MQVLWTSGPNCSVREDFEGLYIYISSPIRPNYTPNKLIEK